MTWQLLLIDLCFFDVVKLKRSDLLSFEFSIRQFRIFGKFHVCVHEIIQVTVPRKYYPRCVNALLVPVPWPKNPTNLASAISMLLFRLQHQKTQAAQHSFCQIGGTSRLRWLASRFWPVQGLPSSRSSPSDWIDWWSMELVGSVSNLPPYIKPGPSAWDLFDLLLPGIAKLILCQGTKIHSQRWLPSDRLLLGPPCVRVRQLDCFC